ncbi:MAG: hypothetical protein F4057_01970 [Acidobacteria bacterium]|nr:hypothetical protein [Acidobacteriota bacterium]
MGTSTSSTGPGSGVPIVPPWTPPPPSADPMPPDDSPGDPPAPSPVPPSPIAPPGRFRGTRRALSDYARSGNSRQMRRGVRDYIGTGYGGAALAARRHGGTAVTAGALGDALAGLASADPAAPESGLDRALREAQSAEEIISSVVEAVRPVDGTQDSEVERVAISDALSDLLSRYPDAELSQLDSEQRAFAVERFVAVTVFSRFVLDVGKTIHANAPSAVAAVERLDEVLDYVDETVAASFRSLRAAGRTLDSASIERVVHAALTETFEIFEAFL